jgi:hypothetical protein
VDTVIHVVESVIGAALASLVIWFPLAIPRRTRKVAGWLVTAVSIIWLFGLWVAASLFVYATWHWTGLVIGWILAGIGVIPLAIMASLVTGQFHNAIVLTGWLAAVTVLRFTGVFIYTKGTEPRENDAAREPFDKLDPKCQTAEQSLTALAAQLETEGLGEGQAYAMEFVRRCNDFAVQHVPTCARCRSYRPDAA